MPLAFSASLKGRKTCTPPRVEREHLKKALKEAQAAHDATSDEEQRLDISKRIVELASRYIAIGGDRYHLHDLPKPKAARKAKA